MSIELPLPVLVDRPRPDDTRATDAATWAATHLRVRDLGSALFFWRDLLGLQVARASADEVTLGVEDAELIVLHAGAQRPVPRGHSGLFHVALHVPSAKAFAETYSWLVSRNAEPRSSDHLLHWAMYLWDQDGIGVELSFETADRFDHVIPTHPPIFVGTDGREHGPSDRLDVPAILEAFPEVATDSPLAAGTRIGHNHLHVGDLAASAHFYTQLGFVANQPIMGMRDFNARGSFMHRLAINEWQGPGAPAAPADAAGLHYMQLLYAHGGALQTALADLERAGFPVRRHEHPSGVAVTDPSGNVTRLTDAAT